MSGVSDAAGGAAGPSPGDRHGTPHRVVNPPTLAAPVGFAHAVVSVPGRTVHLAGQTAQRPDGTIIGPGLVEQFDQALANLLEAMRAAGAEPGHLVALNVYTTDVAAYRDNLKPLGAAYRRHLGRHYPAMALFGVSGLLAPEAKVELLGTAVIPDP
ncbi:RidA family protein [Nocardiopsis rhodophaea]|uniref:RidA family protein n=1 Tax=Nocardiopsis rhodophaea TaxID=280238 RepID=A0ABN2SNU6_9ACTN